MSETVSTLLREFPRIRRKVFSGESVTIKTKEGNMRITRERADGASLLGSMKGRILQANDQLVEPTTGPDEWRPSL